MIHALHDEPVEARTMATLKEPAGSVLPPIDPAALEEEVALQVMVPGRVRRQVALICAERGECLRTVVLRGLRAIGVEISETELVDRRGRRRKG
jgi:hypothetical protein